MNGGIPWTEADDVRLTVLWAEGHVASAIGREMGRSKNGVIGRAHRLCLPLRPSPIPGHVPAALKPPPARLVLPPVVVAPLPLQRPPPIQPVRACQYPFGHPRTPEFRYCEAAVRDGGPYCPTHRALCYGVRRDLAA